MIWIASVTGVGSWLFLSGVAFDETIASVQSLVRLRDVLNEDAHSLGIVPLPVRGARWRCYQSVSSVEPDLDCRVACGRYERVAASRSRSECYLSPS